MSGDSTLSLLAPVLGVLLQDCLVLNVSAASMYSQHMRGAIAAAGCVGIIAGLTAAAAAISDVDTTPWASPCHKRGTKDALHAKS